MTDEPVERSVRTSNERPFNVPVIHRVAAISHIDFDERIIRMIAVPYGEQTVINEQGRSFVEEFDPDAFKGIETSKTRIPIYRGHDPDKAIGIAKSFDPTNRQGLIAEAYISDTPLGEDTLRLARDGVLGASVGAAVRPSDVQRRTVSVGGRTLPLLRRMRAFLDHIALLPNPAYLGATVLAVRQGQAVPAEESLLETPKLDSVLALLGEDYWKSTTRR
jgi:phage head maturation protease